MSQREKEVKIGDGLQEGRLLVEKKKSVDLEDASCPLGCQASDEVVLVGHDRLHDLPGEYKVVQCTACKLMRTNPRPSAATISFYYPDDYGPYLGTQIQEVKPHSRVKKMLKPLINRTFNTRSQELPSLAPGRMLEIGCASGAFLHQMANKGWKVEGIEFSEKAARAASQLGYKVHAGSLESAPAPEHSFDLIVGWMVLEHLHDPIGCLEKLHDWASPGAWLALSVPNAKSLEFQIFKDKWYALQLPTHLHHFTPESLATVLEAGGWQLQKVHHQRSIINLIASASYVANSKGWLGLGRWLYELAMRGGMWFYLTFPFAWILGGLGQTGRMTVWARKRSVTNPPLTGKFSTLQSDGGV